ncbi:MAG TPA: hypothetical protein VFV87_02030 [Pirellulaceae bacterium]|nr:hypothetical protein [Pirellulaceae bacterium]
MKRNWLPYVAIAAALVAGSICSTAFAGPPSFKFGGNSGGGNFRIGGTNNSGGNNLSRNLGNVRIQQGTNNSLPKIGNFNGSSGGMQTQIKKLPGNLGNLNGNLGQAIGNSNRVTTPKITINPGVVNQIKQGNLNGNGNGHIGQAIGNAVLNGNKNVKINPGFNKGNLGQAIGNAIVGGGSQKSIQCGPVKVGCQPWWNDCHHFHHDHCYKPVYPVCSQTIIVQVPVEQPVAVAQPAMQVPVGATLTLQSLGLGDAAGQVMIQVDKIAIPAMVNEWTNDAVTTTLPMLGLGGQVIADIVMVRADGTVANSIKVELINAQPQAQDAQVVPASASAPAGAGDAAAALFAQ